MMATAFLLAAMTYSTGAVHLSQKRLSFRNAEFYCSNLCNSHLASIHSQSQFDSYISALSTIDDTVWIGLRHNSSASNSAWTDGSSTDYVSTSSSTINSSSNQCATINKESTEWQFTDCDTARPFLCHSCTNTLGYDGNHYFFVENEFDWSQAQTYCQQHCDSELASIHDIAQYLSTANIAATESYTNMNSNSSDDVWLGLAFNTMYTRDWSWSDSSSFDYATDDTQYPWKYPSSTVNGYYVYMDATNEFLWDDDKLQKLKRSLCNSCDNKFTKYIGIQSAAAVEGDDAEQLCNDYYGTSLASIRSAEDNQEALLLADIFDSDVWIGLKDQAVEGTFTWTDDTPWDYGNDIATMGVYPWQNGEPDNVNTSSGCDQDCVAISTSNESTIGWFDEFCNGCSGTVPTKQVLCNTRSQLCDAESIQEAQRQSSHIVRDGVGDCEVIINGGTSMLVMTGKQWANPGQTYRVHYMYSIVGNIFGDSGVLINFQSNCQYYYVGVSVVPAWTGSTTVGNYSLFIEKREDSSSAIVAETRVAYQPGTYYQLEVAVTDQSIFNVSMNGVRITYNDGIVSDQKNPEFSGYVGIRNTNLNVIAKSLFVTGSKVHMEDSGILSYFASCETSEPTVDPTYMPTESTLNPTSNPTDSPTQIDTTSSTMILDGNDDAQQVDEFSFGISFGVGAGLGAACLCSTIILVLAVICYYKYKKESSLERPDTETAKNGPFYNDSGRIELMPDKVHSKSDADEYNDEHEEEVVVKINSQITGVEAQEEEEADPLKELEREIELEAAKQGPMGSVASMASVYSGREVDTAWPMANAQAEQNGEEQAQNVEGGMVQLTSMPPPPRRYTEVDGAEDPHEAGAAGDAAGDQANADESDNMYAAEEPDEETMRDDVETPEHPPNAVMNADENAEEHVEENVEANVEADVAAEAAPVVNTEDSWSKSSDKDTTVATELDAGEEK